MAYLPFVKSYQVVVVGGGLAGLTAALDLKLRGKEVLVIEKTPYPHHKVCGEFVSNEVRPYLDKLGFAVEKCTSVEIDTLQLGTCTGKSTTVKLPLGGFGISRYEFDFQLYQLALSKGVEFRFTTVQNIEYVEDSFVVESSGEEKLCANVVIGAFGKRSSIDKRLGRPFIHKKSAWLAVKCHYKNYDFPENLVSLQTFPGGYGGLSKTEDGSINFCYLAQYEHFKKYSDIGKFESEVVSKNPVLRHFQKNASPVFDKHLSIAQVSFDRKQAIWNHIVMCGDTAGLIHPLCGNGMAMAIHGAKIASEQVCSFLENEKYSRMTMEKDYEKKWKSEFRNRMNMGRFLQGLMLHTNWFDFGLSTLASSKKVLTGIISATHGKVILQ